MLTGATHILMLEGLETQHVVQAIERHASRYGVPGELFIDNGTLEHVRFSITDIDSQVLDTLGIRVHMSNAKSQEVQGKVE